MTSFPCNIALLPSKDIAHQAVATSQKLEAFNTRFTLCDGEFYPHISLYMVQLDIDNPDKLRLLLSDIPQNTNSIKLTAKGFRQASGYIDVEYHRNKAIDDLQMQVVNHVNPIRDGLREKDKKRIETATGTELKNLRSYGYRGIGSEFAPHITFTRLVEDRQIVLNEQLSDFNGDFSKIGLFKMGNNGTCVKKIFELPLA